MGGDGVGWGWRDPVDGYVICGLRGGTGGKRAASLGQLPVKLWDILAIVLLSL